MGKCARRDGGEVPGVFFFDVLNSASTLYASDRKAGRVTEAGDTSSLPFEGALKCLVEFCRRVEIDNVDVSVRCCDDEHFVFFVHAIDPLLTVDRSHGRLLAQVPVFYGLVPRSSDNDRT